MRGRSPSGNAAGVIAALLATIAVAHGAEPVVPEADTGSVLKQRLELLDKATDLTDRFVAARAIGYVDGIVDGAAGLGFACYPAGVARPEIREVVKKYLRDHPERLGDPASMLVLNALFEAYPCRHQDPQ